MCIREITNIVNTNWKGVEDLHQKQDQFRVPVVPNTLEGLQIELKSAILHFSADCDSLKALVHAIPSFYHVYTGVRQSVLSTVALREIHPDVIPDALAVHRFAKMDRQGPDQVKDFLAKYKTDRHPKHVTLLSIPLSIELLAFHKRYIEFFTEDFTFSILLILPISRKSEMSHAPPSSTEIRRIHRSFYRFELYCLLFKRREIQHGVVHDRERLGSQAQSDMFLSLFPPWEVEEICCVHDYLYRRLSTPFDEVAQHDVEMGELGLNSRIYLGKTPNVLVVPHSLTHLMLKMTFDTGGGFDDEYKEFYLSLGLTFLYKILNQSQYEEWRELILDNIYTDYDFLVQALEKYYPCPEFADIMDEDADMEFHRDDGSGPNEAWLWSNEYSNAYFVNNGSKADLRTWGYCMWDRQRLSAWCLLQQPYDRAHSRARDDALRAELKVRYDEALRTEELRSNVWLKGGSGYWTEDESKIVWDDRQRRSGRVHPLLARGNAR
ncbi:MAG: hypothetical protein M1830_003128 [Pleopsidium flavum]|nr:MAG: hypothetical protein M1830_003128 [Pleopsidium flavum]